MRTIPLGGALAAGRVALVDDEDYELVSRHSWCVWVRRQPGKNSGPYAVTGIPAGGTFRNIRMHKLITGWPQTDHKDHDGLNNQRSNLRPATQSQNQGNQRPQAGRSSRYKGVGWLTGQRKWRAYIKIDGKSIHLGLFTSEEDAARAYDFAAIAAWGEFACLNFPA